MTSAQKASALFWENYQSKSHIIINQGGSNSGKTHAILLALFYIACENRKQVITIVGQDIPNLKAGALRDALTIWESSKQLKASVISYNISERIITFNTGSLIEFKSYSDAQDAKSGKRDYLFVNEANGVSWGVYSELALRTRTKIYIDYNPNSGFWVHDNLLGRQGVQLIISDHRHNPFLEQGVRDKIEELKSTDLERWKVYARGLTGKIAGVILKNWHVCDAIPKDAKLVAAGLDFGFTNDQTGCLVVYKQNGELWINELFYEAGLTNPDIAEKLADAGLSKSTEIIADSAEPKSIEELKRLGWRIIPAKKGADSVKISIDILKRYRLNITRNSVNLKKELARYTWKNDPSGKAINEPVDGFDHLIDPLRYVALNKLKISNLALAKTRFPFTGEKRHEPLCGLMTI